MANYGIEKLEKAAKILAGVCVGMIGGGLTLLLNSNKTDKDEAADDKKKQPKEKKR